MHEDAGLAQAATPGTTRRPRLWRCRRTGSRGRSGRAPAQGSSSAASSSGTIPSGMVAAQLANAAAITARCCRTPRPGPAPGATISSPVESTATRGRRQTSRRARPTAASMPISREVSSLPRRSTVSPRARSLPANAISCPGTAGRPPSPGRVVEVGMLDHQHRIGAARNHAAGRDHGRGPGSTGRRDATPGVSTSALSRGRGAAPRRPPYRRRAARSHRRWTGRSPARRPWRRRLQRGPDLRLGRAPRSPCRAAPARGGDESGRSPRPDRPPRETAPVAPRVESRSRDGPPASAWPDETFRLASTMVGNTVGAWLEQPDQKLRACRRALARGRDEHEAVGRCRVTQTRRRAIRTRDDRARLGRIEAHRHDLRQAERRCDLAGRAQARDTNGKPGSRPPRQRSARPATSS